MLKNMANQFQARGVLALVLKLLLLSHLSYLGCYADTLCPDNWTAFRGSCYLAANHENLNFHDAERFCKHYGAHLAHVNDATESAFLTSYLSDMKEQIHWIGLTDEITEGIWKWYDTDEAATFNNWHTQTSEPNGGSNQNCVYINAAYQHNWIDAPCSWQRHPLCEKIDRDGAEVIG